MEKRTIEVELYRYDELSQSAKEKVKEWLIETQDPEIFSQDVREDLHNRFGFSLSPEYSLCYCQGDGLCLNGMLYLSDFTNKEELKTMMLKGLKGFQRSMALELADKVEFRNRNNHYSYASRSQVTVHPAYYALTDKQEAIVAKVEENIADWYMKLCAEYERQGYAYFYEMSDEYVRDICIANDYLFYEDGKRSRAFVA